MIVVTGASGKLGRAVLEQLLQRRAAQDLGASTRDPAQAMALAQRGVRVRHGDFADPATLRHAFEGATQLLLVSSNAQAFGQDPLAQHRAAIDAACAVGVQRIVYTSHMAASATSAFPPMRTHAATEQMLKAAGLPYTALRNGYYASVLPMLLGDAARTGVLSAPADGPVCWTTHEDLAAAAAAILLDDGRFEGATPPLTGTEALDLADIAGLLGELHGRPVVRQTVADEVQAQRLAERGVPAINRELVLAMFRAARAGEFAATGHALASLIGRPPRTVRAWLADHAGIKA